MHNKNTDIPKSKTQAACSEGVGGRGAALQFTSGTELVEAPSMGGAKRMFGSLWVFAFAFLSILCTPPLSPNQDSAPTADPPNFDCTS